MKEFYVHNTILKSITKIVKDEEFPDSYNVYNTNFGSWEFSDNIGTQSLLDLLSEDTNVLLMPTDKKSITEYLGI